MRRMAWMLRWLVRRAMCFVVGHARRDVVSYCNCGYSQEVASCMRCDDDNFRAEHSHRERLLSGSYTESGRYVIRGDRGHTVEMW